MTIVPLPKKLSIARFEVGLKKVLGYLLNLDHPEGGPKARFFTGHGFSPDDPVAFMNAIIDQAEVSEKGRHFAQREHGLHYIAMGAIKTPNGTDPLIRSVWKVEDADPTTAVLITAHPIAAKRAKPDTD